MTNPYLAPETSPEHSVGRTSLVFRLVLVVGKVVLLGGVLGAGLVMRYGRFIHRLAGLRTED